jgi:hypothetical protein
MRYVVNASERRGNDRQHHLCKIIRPSRSDDALIRVIAIERTCVSCADEGRRVGNRDGKTEGKIKQTGTLRGREWRLHKVWRGTVHLVHVRREVRKAAPVLGFRRCYSARLRCSSLEE